MFDRGKNIINIKKKKSNSSIFFGISQENGELCSIFDVGKGLSCNCLCPACKTRLEARKGEKNVHHFAHNSNTECYYGAELSIYQALYELLKKKLNFFIPDVVYRDNYSHKSVTI